MQSSILKLKEIIWEITGACANNCKYCGSKENREDKIDEQKIISIANEIIKCTDLKEVNISGGDPLLVSYNTHKTITDLFRGSGIIPKIIINPMSVFDDEERKFNDTDILSLYSWIGVSVNNNNEMQIFDDSNLCKFQNITIITNFNLNNIWMFDSIKLFISKLHCNWTIQYTMYKDDTNIDNDAIYNNDEANKYFFAKINELDLEEFNYTLGDNINSCKCGAGTRSLGILSNGDIVPCLSMRAWKSKEELADEIQGNVDYSLDSIWRINFEKYRFSDFKCCKDACKNKLYKKPEIVENKKEVMPGIFKNIDIPNMPIHNINQVMVYGVNISNWKPLKNTDRILSDKKDNSN